MTKDYKKMYEELLEKQKYGLVFEQHKEDVEDQKFKVVEDESKKINNGGQENLLIEGDNYHSLLHLKEEYKGKVDVVYIDPPYNTGNKDFVYNDKMVDGEDVYKHSKWLSFMEKRLKLARELMSDEGVIFISIDDNEMAQLKLLCDSIFGEKNFISNIIWKKKTGASDANYIATVTEYVLIYKNSSTKVLFKKNKNALKKSRYNNSDKWENNRGKFYYDTLDRGSLRYSNSLNYPIMAPDSTPIYPNDRSFFKNDGWTWRWSKEKVKWGVDNGYISFEKDNNRKTNWRVKVKNYMFVDNNGKQIDKESPYLNFYSDSINTKGSKEIKDIFGKKAFSYPKPTEFITHILNFIHNRNITILDFFAGSGTTGHSVLELNKEDGGNRKFILCTNNENNIAEEVTYERIKRVINGYTTPKNKKVEGLSGSLRYYRIDTKE